MKDNQINFNNYFKIFNIFSISFIIISISLLLFKGLNYGVDFKGGTLIELRATDNQITISQLRQSFLNMNLGDVSVKEFGKNNDFLVKFEKKETNNSNLIGEIKLNLTKLIGPGFNLEELKMLDQRLVLNY